MTKTISELRELWKQRYQEGYFDDGGHLKLHFVTRVDVEPLAIAMRDDRPPLTRHQLRRFFQHCRFVEQQLKTGDVAWEEARVDIHRLDNAAADAFGKSPENIPELFHDFICWNVAAAANRKAFLDGFVRHFEALVGFGTRHYAESERER
ncbi:MAG: hypothetical protein R3C59_03820 [Planctomycetaceae bacterium]